MRKIIYASIIALTIYYVATHTDELGQIIDVIKQGDSRWFLAAVLVQILWLIVIAAALQACYRLMGLRESVLHLIPLTMAANFVTIIAPSYGVGALAVLIADGRRRGKPAGKVSTAIFLYLVYDYLGFMIVLVLGWLVLIRHGIVDTVLIGASVLAAGIAVSLVVLTLLGIQSAERFGRAVLGMVDLGNRWLHLLFRRDLINRSKAEGFSQEIAEGLKHIRRSPGGLIRPGILAIVRKLVMMTILFMISMAFHRPFDVETLIASFSVGYLFNVVSITPAGVGFVEGALTLTQTALGVPLETSAAIALAYRGITFWLVVIYGPFALRLIGYLPGRDFQKDPVQTIEGADLVSAQTTNPSSDERGPKIGLNGTLPTSRGADKDPHASVDRQG